MAVRLIYGRGRFDHVTGLMRDRQHCAVSVDAIRPLEKLNNITIFKVSYYKITTVTNWFGDRGYCMVVRYAVRWIDDNLVNDRSLLLSRSTVWNILPDFVTASTEIVQTQFYMFRLKFFSGLNYHNV